MNHLLFAFIVLFSFLTKAASFVETDTHVYFLGKEKDFCALVKMNKTDGNRKVYPLKPYFKPDTLSLVENNLYIVGLENTSRKSYHQIRLDTFNTVKETFKSYRYQDMGVNYKLYRGILWIISRDRDYLYKIDPKDSFTPTISTGNKLCAILPYKNKLFLLSTPASPSYDIYRPINYSNLLDIYDIDTQSQTTLTFQSQLYDVQFEDDFFYVSTHSTLYRYNFTTLRREEKACPGGGQLSVSKGICVSYNPSESHMVTVTPFTERPNRTINVGPHKKVKIVGDRLLVFPARELHSYRGEHKTLKIYDLSTDTLIREVNVGYNAEIAEVYGDGIACIQSHDSSGYDNDPEVTKYCPYDPYGLTFIHIPTCHVLETVSFRDEPTYIARYQDEIYVDGEKHISRVILNKINEFEDDIHHYRFWNYYCFYFTKLLSLISVTPTTEDVIEACWDDRDIGKEIMTVLITQTYNEPLLPLLKVGLKRNDPFCITLMHLAFKHGKFDFKSSPLIAESYKEGSNPELIKEYEAYLEKINLVLPKGK